MVHPRRAGHTGMVVCSLWTLSAPSKRRLLVVDTVAMLVRGTWYVGLVHMGFGTDEAHGGKFIPRRPSTN